jgi:hypothetical protein
MHKILVFVKQFWFPTILIFIWLVFMGFLWRSPPTHKGEPLPVYSDGVQNHLIWNIKGECYFVRPNDDVTVYLIRVQDCDKK